MSVVIMDLDSTLIKSKKLKENISKAILAEKKDMNPTEADKLNGFKTAEDFNKFYQEYNDKKGKSTFSIKNFINYLGVENKKFIDNVSNKVFNNMEDYLFDGAEKLISNLKAKGHKLVLISMGDREHQKKKLAKLVADSPIFEKEYFVDKSKLNEVKELMETYRTEKFIIMNDNQLEIDGMKEMLGERCEGAYLMGAEEETAEEKQKRINNEPNSRRYTLEELNAEMHPESKEPSQEFKFNKAA